MPPTTEARIVFTSESWFGDRPASIPATSFSDAARVARPKRVQRYVAISSTAIASTIPAIQKTALPNRDIGHGEARVPRRQDVVRCLRRRAEAEQHRRLQRQQDAERREELRQRRRRPQRPEDEHLHQHAEQGAGEERDDECRDRPQREPEEVVLQRPERVRRDHRDRAGREVDDPRPAVREDEREREPGDDARRVPSPSRAYRSDLIHARPVRPARSSSLDACRFGYENGGTQFEGGGTQSPAFLNTPLPA